ncbi:MAG: precorrin-8X methylmutase [Alphaproteobacteria bacterium]
MPHAYQRSPEAITAQSFAIIRAEANLGRLAPELEGIAVRLIHACGMVDLVDDIAASAGALDVGRAALALGAPILVDTPAVAAGITRARLPASNPVICTLGDPAVPKLAKSGATTLSAAAIELWRSRLHDAVVAIGVAPTALFRLLEIVEEGAARPALVIGMPVGFVGAAESKKALIASGLPHIAVRGRRGGSALAAAAVNAIARP